MKNQQGVSIIEMLLALLLISILFFPMIDLLNTSFMAEYNNRVNVEAKEFREAALNRMTNVLKEASYLYDETVTVPTDIGTYEVEHGDNAIIALVPVYDSESGELDYSGNQVKFNGYAYSLIPVDEFSTDFDSVGMVLVESFDSFYCDVTSDDPRIPDGTCNTDWSETGTSNIIFEGARPAYFEGYSSSFNPVSSNQVEFTFGAKEGKVYYHSDAGSFLEADYLNSIDIFLRNVPNS